MPSFALSLKNRLLAVALLGVLSCVVALYGLGRILQHTTALRTERARETVTAQCSRCCSERRLPARGQPASPTTITVLGMRGGYVSAQQAFDVPRPDLGLEEPTVRRARGRDLGSGGPPAHGMAELGRGGRGGAGSAGGGRGRGADGVGLHRVDRVHHAPERAHRHVASHQHVAHADDAAVVVGMAISTVVLVSRGAATLNASLGALANDLTAPVPRPPVPELACILADHIAGLAGALAQAQEAQERLGAELAQRDRLAALGRVVAGVAHEGQEPARLDQAPGGSRPAAVGHARAASRGSWRRCRTR